MSLRSHLIAIAIKGALALAIGAGLTAYLTRPVAHAHPTENQRADLTNFIAKYAAKAPRRSRSQWKG